MSLSSVNNEAPVASKIFAPATESQLEVWISCLLGGEDANRAYNLSISQTLYGDLNRSYFEESLQELINRHQALRSTFSADGIQVHIAQERKLDLYFGDLSSTPDTEKRSFLNKFIKEDVNIAFDLHNGPLYKLSLFKLADQQHLFIFTAHHIICDGWSMGLFLEELGKIYSAHVTGKPHDLPAPALFSDYALQQKEFSESNAYKEIEQFWLDQYGDDVPVLDIPADFPRPALRTNKSYRDDYILDKTLVDDIRALSSREKSSLAITLRAVFEIFLYKLTGQSDIVLGLPTAGQAVTGNYHLMSHCINLLPLRSHYQEELSFTEYLKHRKFATLDAYENQQFTFGSLLKKLNIPRDSSRLPLVSVVFSIDMGMDGSIRFEGLEHDLISNKRDYENFEIFVNATNVGENLVLEWTYNTQLFKAETIKIMMDDFQSLLHTVVKNPGVKLKDILLKDSAELTNKLSEWNNTAAEYPRNTPLPHLIALNAGKYPDQTAIIYQGSHTTYKELEEKANRLANFLIQHHVQTGDKIALALDRSTEMVISLLAIMKAGAAYIPVDPDYPIRRIEYMLTDSAIRLLLTSEKYKGKFAGNTVTEIVLDDLENQLSACSTEAPQVDVNGHDLAYVIYTSGSTGKPKGIAIEHHSLVNFLFSMQKSPGITASDRLLAVTTISFDIAGLELYLPLIAGAELLLADAEAARDGRELLGMVRSEKVTIMQATPSTWRMMLALGWDEPIDLKVLCGGEALPKDIATLLLNRCSQLWNMYGPTETTIWSAIKQITNSDEPIVIGRPIDNTQIYILDKHLKPVPHGGTGEIYIAGEGLAREYLNQPELTAKSFLDNPFAAEENSRIYRTGDLGMFMPNGEIQCFGRIDNQVKIRGYRIELGAIEDALNNQEGIKEAVVVAKEDRPGDQRLVAYIATDITAGSAETGSEPGSEQTGLISTWKQGLKELLPAYMIPGDFVLLEKLPLLPNGKIDRNALPKYNAASDTKREQALPHTDTEKLIAKVWSEFLGIETIGLHDDFFELGGHSLIAVQVMVWLEKETGCSLPLTTLFKHSVLEQFAALYSNYQKPADKPVSHIPDQKAAVISKATAPYTKPAVDETVLKASKKTSETDQKLVLPRTDIEKLVASIWAEYLGQEQIGVYDDFFELGGHSLVAVQVLARLEQETGKRLPLATLFDHSTVEAMALMLKMDAKSITWDSLVPIKPHGHKMPLYIVHGAGLNVLFFNTLAKNMDADQPVYGLQAKGLNGIDEPLEKIEDMAAYYISEIINQNPKGPYALAGFSFGGIIAFEMAKQLKSMGKEVRMLAMFDTYAYQSDRYEPLFTKMYNRIRYFTKQLLYTFTLLKEDPKRTIEYKSEAIKRRLIRLYWKFKYGKDQKQEGFFGYVNKIDVKNVQAWEKYILTPYNGSIQLFRAKKRTFYMDDFEYLGWKPFALKGITIHEIPGEHNYIFAPPNDQQFARILQDCLDNAVK